MIRVRCLKCGMAHYAGHDHACQSVTGMANNVAMANDVGNAENGVPVTYRYRDPDKRRAYMRELMRRKRSGTVQ